MPKFIIYKDTKYGRRYLNKYVCGRPYCSSDTAMAEVCENKELAEFIAKCASNYSGSNWKVMEVEPDGE